MKILAQIELDASRWRKVRSLTTCEVAELSPEAKAVWKRLIKGGWYTDDLDKMIDSLADVEAV